MLQAAESVAYSLGYRLIIFEVTKTIWPQYLNVTDGLTDK